MTEYKLKFSCGDRTVTLTEKQLLKVTGNSGKIGDMSLTLARKDETSGKEDTLTAYATTDGGYCGIYVDGTMDGEDYYLTLAELPTDENKNIVTRLYGGNAELDGDSPIVAMCNGKHKADSGNRVVYIDWDCCTTASYNEDGALSKVTTGDEA